MSEPNHVALAKMELLLASQTMQTTIVGIGDVRRRTTMLSEFSERYKNDSGMCSVAWSTDTNLQKVPSRCNGNLVLLSLGAKANQTASYQAFTIPDVLVLPRKQLGAWTQKHLKVAHSQYEGHDRVQLAEPAKYELTRYFDYVPKPIFEAKDEYIRKFVEEFKPSIPQLKQGHVTVHFILLRCNFGLGHRSDWEDHVYYTHGADINKLEIMPTIKINDGETLVLAVALNLKDMSKESRSGIYDSWFIAAIANGTVTMIDNKENAKILKHKSEGLLKALRIAVGAEMFNKIFYALQNSVQEGHDISLGFTGKWSLLTDACEAALGPMANVKRARNFISGKDHICGGMSLNNTLNRVPNLVESSFGKIDIVSTLDDGTEINNRGVKEFIKYTLAFEIAESLPATYDCMREDLTTGISKNMFDPEMTYKKFVTEIGNTIATKGNSVLFKDAILPALTRPKYSNNSASTTSEVLSNETKVKFMEVWNKAVVNEEEDNKRRQQILEAVEPKASSTELAKTVVYEMEEVKKIIGEIRLCWGCLSNICWRRSKMSFKAIGKRLVNRFCPIKKLLLGDPNLARLLKTKVAKNNFKEVGEKVNTEGAKGSGKPPKKKNYSMTVIKPTQTEVKMEEEKEEEIKRANLTGVPDEDLFAPDWLREEPNIFVEKKVFSTNIMKKAAPQTRRCFVGYCPWCRGKLYDDDPCDNCGDDFEQYNTSKQSQQFDTINQVKTDPNFDDKDLVEIKQKLEKTVEEVKSFKKFMSEASGEIIQLKNSTNVLQQNVDVMSEDMSALIDDHKDLDKNYMSFKNDVVDRCGEYVSHMEKTDVKIIGLKEEVSRIEHTNTAGDKLGPIIQQNCEQYFLQASNSMAKNYASKSKIKELSTNITQLEARVNNIGKTVDTASNSDSTPHADDTPPQPSPNFNDSPSKEMRNDAGKSANEIIKEDWYNFCLEDGWMPDKFRPSFVHPNAVTRNKVKIDYWYSECIRINIIPDEFLLVAEGRKDSFHKRQKKAWKQKNLETPADDQNEYPFEELFTFKPKKAFATLRFIFAVLLFVMCSTNIGAANSVNVIGYRPEATRSSFRTVSHSPSMAEHLKNLNTVDRNISTLHANHVGIQTYVHELGNIIRNVEAGIDESCRSIAAFSEECRQFNSSCQFIREGISTNKKTIKKYIQILNTFSRVCIVDHIPSSSDVFSRCERSENWKKIEPADESYGIIDLAIDAFGFDHKVVKRALFTMAIIGISTIIGSLAVTGVALATENIARSEAQRVMKIEAGIRDVQNEQHIINFLHQNNVTIELAAKLDRHEYIATLMARGTNELFQARERLSEVKYMFSLDKKWDMMDPNTEAYQSMVRSFAVEGIRGLTQQEYGEVQRLMSGMAVSHTSVFSEDPQIKTCATTTVMKTLVIPVLDNLYITEYETRDESGKLVMVNSKPGHYNVIPSEAILSQETTLFNENVQVTGRSCQISDDVRTEVESTGDFLTDKFRFIFNGTIIVKETCMTAKGTVSTNWTFTNEAHIELPVSCGLESKEIKCSSLSLTTNKAVVVEVGPQRMRKIVKSSVNADSVRISEEEFRGNISSTASGLIIPNTTLGLNNIYWIPIGIIIGGAIITTIVVGICKYRRPNRTTPESATPAGGTVVTNNIQVSTSEPKYTLIPFKKKCSNGLEMNSYPIIPETLTQDEIKAIEANKSDI